MLISEAFRMYAEDEVLAIGGSENTVNNYYYTCKLLVDFLGDINIQKVGLMDFRKFSLFLQKSHKNNTVRNDMSCVRSVIRMCKKRGLSVVDPAEIKVPKREKTVVKYLEKDDVDKFIEMVGKPCRGYPEINRVRNVVFVTLLFQCGLRIGELCRLDRDSIRNRQFTVVGKSKNPRVCFITRKMESMIRDYLRMRDDNNPALFYSNQSGNRMTASTARLVFRRVCRNSDYEMVHPHTMRHSFATYLMDRGVGLREIAELLGHESMETTKIYTHVKNKRLEEVYNTAMS